jgi:hypothetical protein
MSHPARRCREKACWRAAAVDSDAGGCRCYTQGAGEENMPTIASARSKQLAAVLLISAVSLLSPSMALAHSGGGGSGGGGGHSGGGGGSSSSGSHSSGHSAVSSSSHSATAISEGRTHTTAPKNSKRRLFFGHVMHTVCDVQPASTAQTHTDGCDTHQKRVP